MNSFDSVRFPYDLMDILADYLGDSLKHLGCVDKRLNKLASVIPDMKSLNVTHRFITGQIKGLEGNLGGMMTRLNFLVDENESLFDRICCTPKPKRYLLEEEILRADVDRITTRIVLLKTEKMMVSDKYLRHKQIHQLK